METLAEKKKNDCFEHPYITMVNTLKNEGFEKDPSSPRGWIYKGSVYFNTALEAYEYYMNRCCYD